MRERFRLDRRVLLRRRLWMYSPKMTNAMKMKRARESAEARGLCNRCRVETRRDDYKTCYSCSNERTRNR